MTQDIYERLAFHLSTLGMGWPYRENLLDILRENFTPQEAEVALALPSKVAPLHLAGVDDIARNTSLPRKELEDMLESLSERGLLFTGKIREGEKGYALQQVSFGFPQSFFWKGEDTPHARKMAELVAKYFNRQVTQEANAGSETKPFRYIPVGKTIDREIQAVYPYHTMEKVIQQAKVFAVAHCPCRMSMQLKGRGCEHPLEMCMNL